MKKYLGFRQWMAVTALLLGGSAPLSAQMFEDSVSAPAVSNSPAGQTREQRFNNSWANPRRGAVQPNAVAKQPVEPAQPNLSVDKTGAQAAQQARKNAAEELSRSLAGKRGTGAIRRMVSPGEKNVEDDGLIFLFYKDFKISQSMGGMVMCDVRFNVLHTLPTKINNISFRLKWPEIETSMSYNDVEPNVETFFNYTLVGDGCYSMDKIPNVIVNRCRIKGISQRECANKIRWLKK